MKKKNMKKIYEKEFQPEFPKEEVLGAAMWLEVGLRNLNISVSFGGVEKD